ncbi:HMG box-containing protein 4 [Culicoides brevitarsis]|uniref:HMG box-containing protein 4 n=1 Tax=Culicoides brevitarsis TaxID=469753 RepID=UPI00307C8131
MEPNSGAKDTVTGVSRSGRICKKSTKLQDFQSPEEIDVKPRKLSPNKNTARLLDFPSPSHTSQHESESFGGEESSEESPLPEDDWNSNAGGSRKVPHRSLYMQEKSSKRQKLLKDGTIVMSKAQRKDKGKPRFTAYMLWAKETRQQLMDTNPDMDFASASKRLGEMWANVPGSHKHQWKRKAKRLQTKIKKNANKTAAAQQQANKIAASKAMSASTARRAAKRIESEEQLKVQKSQLPPGKKITGLSLSPAEKPPKMPNYQPLDIAAHLKLLGESLETIGERLKEHEGQITVSGSLSVLLDSLLCSLGPLMCLTTQVPELKLERLGPTFSNTLDNIAYVMPGL